MAQAIGKGMWTDYQESPEAAEFWMKHGSELMALRNAVDAAFKAHDGNTLLLMDAALRGLVGAIMEGFQKHQIRIEVQNEKE